MFDLIFSFLAAVITGGITFVGISGLIVKFFLFVAGASFMDSAIRRWKRRKLAR